MPLHVKVIGKKFPSCNMAAFHSSRRNYSNQQISVWKNQGNIGYYARKWVLRKLRKWCHEQQVFLFLK